MGVNEVTDLLRGLIREIMVRDKCTYESAFRTVEIELEYIKRVEL